MPYSKVWTLNGEGGFGNSFRILHRGLLGYEQLDISTKGCETFIKSYWPESHTADCYNIANIGCFTLWLNFSEMLHPGQ